MPRSFSLVSRLCFRIPEANVRELDDLYVDNLVYVEPWRKAMKAHRADWLLHASWALALLMCAPTRVTISPPADLTAP